MKVTLTHDGKSVELDLTNEQLTALGLKEEKRTGYERVGNRAAYYYPLIDGELVCCADNHDHHDDAVYANAHYHSDEKLAKANARADRLMRQLRRFAAENGGIMSPNRMIMNNSDKISNRAHGYAIAYDGGIKCLYISEWTICKEFGSILFLSRDAAKKAIEKFRDELIWYFTEYEAMLR